MVTSGGALDLDLRFAPQERGQDLLGDLGAIRAAEPVFWSEQSGCWLLTRHADVADMFMNRLPLRHAGRIEAFQFGAIRPADRHRVATLLKYVPKWIINLDGEQHLRIRALLVKALGRRIVESFRDDARAIAHRLLDEAIGTPGFEFNEGFARPMAGQVLFKLVGLPEELFPQLKDWAIGIVEGLASGNPSIELLERADRAAFEMNQAVLVELDKRRIAPRDDLLTNMLNVTEAGEKLSVDELLAQLQIIIIAGHDTTANTMTLGVEALARSPDAWRFMRDNPDQIANCVAEIQRYTAMSGGQSLIASESFELHGKRIEAGQVVVGMIAAADRDPLVFADPEILDMTRDNRKSLVFAPGPHFCLGHVLARMQLTEFFSALVSRCAGIDILDDRLAFMPVFTFRGLYALNVHLKPLVNDISGQPSQRLAGI